MAEREGERFLTDILSLCQFRIKKQAGNECESAAMPQNALQSPKKRYAQDLITRGCGIAAVGPAIPHPMAAEGY
jgi:hypothetical protein